MKTAVKTKEAIIREYTNEVLYIYRLWNVYAPMADIHKLLDQAAIARDNELTAHGYEMIGHL